MKHSGQYILGLDIGIASVGYGLINNDTKEIIDAGVRLFPEGKSDENDGRRSKRGSRRLLRRRKHRIANVKSLLAEYGISIENNSNMNPYEIRVKGLSEKLSDEELAAALIHLSKRRGIHNVDVTDDSEESSELSTKDQINRNAKLLTDKHVAELQLERLNNEGSVRGHSNRFKTNDYIKEAEALLDKQIEYNQKIDGEFKRKYIHLINRRRAYYEGPGEGSPFGWNADIKKWYETLMGKCTYYPEELRSVRYAYSASLFNVLNDLNNLVIMRDENDKLTKDEKEHLINNLFKKQKSAPTLNKIAKELGVKEEDIKGYRVDKKDKPEFSTIKIYHDIKGITNNPEILENPDVLDKIAEILTIWQNEKHILEELEKLQLNLNEQERVKVANLTGYTGTHSLSLKLIKQLNSELWESTLNHMGIISNMNLRPKKMEFKGLDKIPVDFVDEWILSPAVKRSLIQSIKVVNEIIKVYGEPKDIIIELARESNSDDKKKFLQKLQKDSQKINEQVRAKISEINGKDNFSSSLFEKVKLWHLQDGLCMYSTESIKIDDLIQNPNAYEVDHIIPRSVSFDDSLNNKVLVKLEENQKKSNMTPYQYLSSGQGSISYEKFKANVLTLAKDGKRISKKKRGYLLEERDINKFEVQKEFINRNLVDTRYTTRELMNLLKLYFKDNEMKTKVKAINGGFTHALRKIWGFNKDRSEDYKHHAEDALIIAMADYIFANKDIFKNQNILMRDNQAIDLETGEILSEKDFVDRFFEDEVFSNIRAIKNFDRYKYSKRVDKKPNRQLMNETIYSSRTFDDGEYIIGKLKNLYDPKNKDVKKKINKNPQAFLMYHHDPQTFEKLQTILDQYSDADNPLAKYYEETGEFLKKYSKEGNGPVVKSLKYKYRKLGAHHDITDKYQRSRNKVFTLSLKPFRIDIYKDGGKYKFVNINYIDVKDVGSEYNVDENSYNEKKNRKNITEQAEFIGSFFKYDLIKIDDQLYSLISIHSESSNKLEVDLVNKSYKEYAEKNKLNKQKYISIGSKNNITKYTTDILGNLYPVYNEKLKMKFPKYKGNE
ncbi:type II CRISPR RNA-guided endonuclease Cas9 [Abyssicoccus albus]|uniref:CRISPR-associated endonuclease Cas9 n=1 Tax=Abyssicoccus albus TaxID=1817405 RepID=A0A3N5C319_9BACL|nr:type II CRISPR RNA-guided endonuclease Cas9 [Abyssicoccus albus]RPF56528.1 CRISPR-associated Csn1 family endonuclease [Abyssicoccus albus]